MMFSWTARARVFFIFIECNQLIIGEVCADRLCDRTADKSEPDKADFAGVMSENIKVKSFPYYNIEVF